MSELRGRTNHSADEPAPVGRQSESDLIEKLTTAGDAKSIASPRVYDPMGHIARKGRSDTIEPSAAERLLTIEPDVRPM
jgi:hypothetical protein